MDNIDIDLLLTLMREISQRQDRLPSDSCQLPLGISLGNPLVLWDLIYADIKGDSCSGVYSVALQFAANGQCPLQCPVA